ncbi:hypothetical protein P389DRAFT_167464 [Cystobasidium minutum MCA 4210]|uniref:uncharacterized protein n=1 Tax=Cystobasidium minutum MCA 4210 TaxID=1397322 RepID=UPI0034CD8959|eukprot:jgi/Rhomi1/167464/fgenesh1_kg.2_\
MVFARCSLRAAAIPRAQPASLLGMLLPGLKASRPDIHLMLDGMTAGHLIQAALIARSVARISRLSIGVQPVSYESLVVIGSLQNSATDLEPWDVVESYPKYPSYPSSRAGRRPSRPGRLPHDSESDSDTEAYAFGRYFDVNWRRISQCGHFIKSLSLMFPDSLYNDWKERRRRTLNVDAFQRCDISGGCWHIGEPQGIPVLEQLILENLFSFSCGSYPRDITFPNLVSVTLSFSPRCESVDWETIACFLRLILAEQLQVVHLKFPVRSPRTQNTSINAAWKDRMSKLTKLREITLVNYIPATLNVITGNQAVRSNLRKLALAEDALPVGFYEDFVPETLPNLEIMDVSQMGSARRTSPAVTRAWVDMWRKAGIALVKGPERG